MGGEGEDAGHVVLAAGALFFGEVADEVAAKLVVLGHYVEEKGFDVVIQSF